MIPLGARHSEKPPLSAASAPRTEAPHCHSRRVEPKTPLLWLVEEFFPFPGPVPPSSAGWGNLDRPGTRYRRHRNRYRRRVQLEEVTGGGGGPERHVRCHRRPCQHRRKRYSPEKKIFHSLRPRQPKRVQVVVATPREGCDEEVETTIGPFWSVALTVTGATDNCESRTDEEVLGSNFCRFGERRGCGDRGRTTSGRGTVVQKGRWHATSDVRAVCTAAFRQIFVTS